MRVSLWLLGVFGVAWLARELLKGTLVRLGERLADWLLPPSKPFTYRAARIVARAVARLAPPASPARSTALGLVSDIATSRTTETALRPLSASMSLMRPCLRSRGDVLVRVARRAIASRSAWKHAAVVVVLATPFIVFGESALAAHAYQRMLFLQHGFVLWNHFWYAGRYSFVTYSVIYYPLAALLGIKLFAVATIALATLAFSVVFWQEWGPASRWSSRTFAIIWAGVVLTAAIPFALGAALGTLALLELRSRGRRRYAGTSLLCLAASPLAFGGLLIATVACGRRRPPTLHSG